VRFIYSPCANLLLNQVVEWPYQVYLVQLELVRAEHHHPQN